MRIVIDNLKVRSAGRAVGRCETTVESAGGCVLAIVTANADQGLTLNSCYLSGLASRPVAVSYMLDVPGMSSQMWQRVMEEEPVGTSLVRASLLDHAVVLRETLAKLWHEPVVIDVSDRALEQTTEAWRANGRSRL